MRTNGANLGCMPRRFLALLIALATATIYLPAAQSVAHAEAVNNSCGATVCAGYGQADATWHVGAGAGQYTNKDADDVVNSVTGGDVDPHGHSIAQHDSYGVQSRLSYRAIVVEDAEGDQTAFIKSDSYLAQDYLSRRAAQILQLNGSTISYDEIFLMASHNHSSPYYMTPSPGPWVFQDAFDIRAFEYHARSLAQAILNAEFGMSAPNVQNVVGDDNPQAPTNRGTGLVPARMGATTVKHELFKGQIMHKGFGDDGTPTGYPDDFGDLGLSVVRFDDISDPANPKPLATLMNWGQHPEDLDNYDLITGEYVAQVERFVERDTGAPVVFGQGDVGSSEQGPGRPELVAKLGIIPEWNHAGHAQTERGAYLLSRDVIRAWNEIGSGNALVPFSSDFDVAAGNAFVAGPYSHPYPSANACRTETTVEGDPGAGSAADCTRTGNDFTGDSDNQFWEQLKAAGVPIPDNYDDPSYFALEENARIHLQAFKLGDVIIGSCSCEAQVDLILNFESRTNDVAGDIWKGYDWTRANRLPGANGEVIPAPLNCAQANPPDGDWNCTPNPAYPRQRATLGPFTVGNDAYQRMKAQVNNDAAGWDLPENTARAVSEPADPSKIYGNFTQTELTPDQGYKLAIGVGHAGDYNGYTISYREYQAHDHYRKALTSYGPHTADYMTKRMMELAATLNGVDEPELQTDIARGAPDEARQVVMSTALGATSFAAYEAWYHALPTDKGPAGEATAEPKSITRFDATDFSWRGGSNAVDNPTVTVQRQVGGEWKNFAGQHGEIQTKVEFPNGIDAMDPGGGNAFTDTYSGNQEWIWTAHFEAFDAFPEGIGSTPSGTYRFVAEGKSRTAPATDTTYEAVSEPFQVKPWEGIKVGDIRGDSDGSVSFSVDPIQYPTSYATDFGYIQTSGTTPQGDGVIKHDEFGQPFCATCTFRPWASTSEVKTATVTVVRKDGSSQKVDATKGSDGRYHAPANLYEGDKAFVDKGGVVDSNGETNGTGSSEVTGTRPRPTPTPTPTQTPTKAVTKLGFTSDSATTGQFSDRATVKARLTDTADKPVSGANVTFTLSGPNGSRSEVARTDSNGIASWSPTLVEKPGSYNLTARYDGDSGHVGSANMTTFVVDKEDSSATLKTDGQGSRRTLQASLFDADDSANAIAGVTVTFLADGEVLGSAQTNNQGLANFDLPPKYRNGHHEYRVRFDGNDYYRATSASVSS